IVIIGYGTVTLYPVFRTDGPGLYDAGNGINAPMDDHPEFLILPPVQFFNYLSIFWCFIDSGPPVQVIFLRADRKGQAETCTEGQYRFFAISHVRIVFAVFCEKI